MHHTHRTRPWHDHDFDPGNPSGERGTRRVVLLAAAMMVAELVAGSLTNSMALLADGLHMGTHVAALGIAAFAYRYARRHAADPRFAFGTWKVGVLAGFASAIILGLVALFMVYESVVRLLNPVPIRYGDAILVAAVGLAVNLLSAWLLHGHDGHVHSHGHDHGRGHDLNLRAAYLHVLADALTSVFAIVALLGGRFFGWDVLDPVMGIVGAVVITTWAWGLLGRTGRVLLDREMDAAVVAEIREVLDDGDAVVVDLHVWRVGPDKFACIVALVAADPLPPDEYRRRLQVHEEIVHVTVEVHPCTGEHPHTEEQAIAH
ncbi:Cadmium, cobalt and zinc/H(+)-K(+) antiporter [Gemmata obscuriglobus]|uniref:Cation transporter n=1 Tax=Gemmata obscuriglobus TaxID=114 RepID=A0A2Z3H2I7_9BACT|nr:CDF family Co(II)/Ni(II) efflux transporter DmeF [Gemmata obscuriglobus]AWM38542.1 cation transporter [Gemmata obscuriglobus]QEG28505.1 Cadmium, cobalt and zinc/H(+)-K(+) antiporter [Gemmata obscuriglobus]VTS06550.1 cation transporter : Cation diffusion facilitator family transporter OS=Allochromatium vinosum (strain ATCC 17899 / DSM 180 / NBRC 103801 / D) GN=Alvin_1529 PE=4 SV=1: Cation_efflux [Gemmata obscuriglobus UQM 2246]